MVRRRLHPLLALLLTLAALACSKDKPRTELVLVVDTDITDLDTIRFEIEDSDQQKSEEAAPRSDGAPLTLGVVRDKGSLGPVTVSALGIRGGETVVERRAEVYFVEGKTLVVELHLVESCVPRRCYLLGLTCTERGCESPELDPDELPTWTGSPPELGTTMAADAGAEAGSGEDGGTTGGDGSNLVTCGLDRNVDLSSDVEHCGSCENACPVGGRNTVPTCMGGECALECRTLYGDCDGDEGNGCEQSLSANMNCGMCGMRCEMGTRCLLGTCR